MAFRVLTVFLLTLFAQITPASGNQTKTFPCGGTASYSVLMPAGVAQDGSKCSGSLNLDLSVKSVGASAFVGSKLTSVTIPNSVTSIGASAFQFTKLTSVTIGNSVTSIGSSAFKDTKLISVAIPNSVKLIGGFAFAQSELTSVTIGNSVTSIGSSAFQANFLTSVIIPNSVTSIGDYAFSYNSRLTTISIPDGLKRLPLNNFKNNVSLTSILYCGDLIEAFIIIPTCPPHRQALKDAKAKEGAEAKGITITCIKGKLTTEVTAIKPKCPSGYKVKK